MRTICDVCESAAAILFCAADEAALCRACDDKVHMCNKLASRHVRVGLADPSGVPRCDICENAPAFFYCEIDGSSLCLQCDMIVHVGGKRTHGRYLLLRQRVEFPGDKPGHPEEPASQPVDQDDNKWIHNHTLKLSAGENQQNQRSPSVQMVDSNSDGHAKMDTKMIDLNMKPQRIHEPPSNNQQWLWLDVNGKAWICLRFSWGVGHFKSSSASCPPHVLLYVSKRSTARTQGCILFKNVLQ